VLGISNSRNKRAVLLFSSILIIAALIVTTLILFHYNQHSSAQNQPLLLPTTTPIAQPEPTPTPTINPTPTPTPLSYAEYSAEVNRLYNFAIEKISYIRNITVPSIPLQVVSKEWAMQTWGVSIAQADTVGITRQENIYKSLLMIPQNASLYEATVDWAGYYMAVVQSGKIYIVQENFDVTKTIDAEATLVHELTHIMQNFKNIPQHYYSFDGNKARTALTEGDASFTASFIKNQTLQNNQPNIINQQYIIQPIALTEHNEIYAIYPAMPDSVSKLNYFPYDYGEKFIQTLYEKGGWETVNQAYKNPPNSTEQILHPEKYFTAEIPKTATEITPPPTAVKEWRRTYTAQYGEFFIQNMLATNLTKDSAQQAAAGWGADKLAYYTNTNQNSTNTYLITWNITWDTVNDAEEFFLAFNNYMNNAGAQQTQINHWQTNQIHQKIIWNQNSTNTIIIATNNPTTLEQITP